MTHELNKEYLISQGWVEKGDGWVPAELVDEEWIEPTPVEEALGMARWLEKEIKALGEEL